VIGPTWLVEDMLRIEQLLLDTAGSSDDPLVGEASTHLIKAGGKRLRPALVMISSRVGTPGRGETDLAAAAIELVHLATLYHDDVIDQTETRRGAPTVHSKWGIEVAVLAGDYLFAKGCGLGADAGTDVSRILARAIAEVCEGQIAETTTLGDPHRSTEAYLSTIVRKTGALFRAACALGAVTSGARDEETAALSAYGTHLGLAFQIVDDLLDLVGDPEVTGKALGTDIREGVFTLPVLEACRRDPGLAELVVASDRDIDDLLARIRTSGAIEDSHAAAKSHADAALASLNGHNDGDWVEALRNIPTGVLAQI
jgi:geranylgeranyl pyrophosphate synthase